MYYRPTADPSPQLGLLTKDHVKIKDPANVERILTGIVDGGFQSLQVSMLYVDTVLLSSVELFGSEE